MGAYILISVLVFWCAVAFTMGPTLLEDAVNAYGDADPVYGNLPFHMIWLTLASLIAFPKILVDAIIHMITVRR